MLISALQKMQAGLENNLKGQTLQMNNAKVKVDDVISTIAAFLTQAAATDAANADWKKLLAAMTSTQKTSITPLMAGLARVLQASYGPQNPILAEFGLTPRRTPTRTLKGKTAGVAKSKATRVARNTMGSKQKKAIHGTVPETTPAPAPSAPSLKHE
jgi:hypothetical protein